MKTSQVIASLSLVGWLALYWIISLNGGFMTGFGPSGPGDPNGPHQINWNQVRMDVAVSFACFIPILALWTPSRLLLGFGAVILVPVAILGLFLPPQPCMFHGIPMLQRRAIRFANLPLRDTDSLHRTSMKMGCYCPPPREEP